LITVQDSLSVTIHGYDSSLRPLPDFPLYVGSVEDINYTPVHPIFAGTDLYAVSHNGDIKGWTFPNAGEVGWKGQYGNASLNKISSHMVGAPVQNEEYGLLNPEETYNWPNPASDETYIRFETSEAANITITVINAGGATVFETSTETMGGMPEEQRLSTSSWGSGVYYCRIKASGNGQTETELIKILVIH
ncbi:MAG: T9SS type A sorting domain-containing protein, partial [Balneolales bacterium]